MISPSSWTACTPSRISKSQYDFPSHMTLIKSWETNNKWLLSSKQKRDSPVKKTYYNLHFIILVGRPQGPNFLAPISAILWCTSDSCHWFRVFSQVTAFANLTPNVFIYVHSALICSHLVYCVQVWSTSLVGENSKGSSEPGSGTQGREDELN